MSIDRVLVAFVYVGYRGRCSRRCSRENVLGRLRRGWWVLRVCCWSHTPKVWTVMEARHPSGTPMWIVQPCASSATSALEVTPVQPAIVVPWLRHERPGRAGELCVLSHRSGCIFPQYKASNTSLTHRFRSLFRPIAAMIGGYSPCASHRRTEKRQGGPKG